MSAILTLSALMLAAGTAGAKATVKYVVVFDFACQAGGRHGSQLADSVRLRLRRDKAFEVIDRLTTAEHTPPDGVSPDTPDADVIKLMKQRLAAHVAVFARVDAAGGLVRAEVRCLDVSGPAQAGCDDHVWVVAIALAGFAG